MKKILTVLSILIVLGAKAQHIVDTSGFTKYRPGYSYVNNHGVKVTLIKQVRFETASKIPQYRWEARFEKGGIRILGWTDDWFIDREPKKGSY